ncbi:MFS transporter [Catelliglobosispora koreensis]|uniref:MFS transporter n=1 Tax=Catelliglobosispora koreensis TaxID=129052 RepID=UPI00146EAD89|nr:MFS transporter [Catelliglobosispora koreensis]
MPHPVSTSSAPSEPPNPERQATFREVFAIREYRALFSATVLSWVGDYLAKIAVAALIFHQTQSPVVTAAAFAISYAPWIVIGPVLTAVAERLPRRSVMIFSDFARMVTIALVALPGLPVWAMIGLLFLTALGNPPYEASRSALVATLLTGDRLVVGVSVQASMAQAAQIAGYSAGGVLAAIDPRMALLINAATFGVSGILIMMFIKRRPAVAAGDERRNILRETGDGFRVVFGTPALRAITLLVFSLMLVAAVQEGMAVVWADSLEPSSQSQHSLYQTLITVSHGAGFIVGGLLIGRLVPPAARQRLVRPLALIAPLTLIPALLSPSLPVVCLIGASTGIAVAGVLPTANGMFVQALPSTHRARAFGVVQSGLQVIQGASVLAIGSLAMPASVLPVVVGWWGLAAFGVVLLTAVIFWPSKDLFTAAIERARRLNQATAAG